MQSRSKKSAMSKKKEIYCGSIVTELLTDCSKEEAFSHKGHFRTIVVQSLSNVLKLSDGLCINRERVCMHCAN